MTVKGIISKLNTTNNTAEIILPEFDNAITAEIPFYNRSAINAHIGEFVVVVLFNGGCDLNNGVIL